MEAPSEVCVCTFDFTGLPKLMRTTKCLHDGTKSTEVSIEVSCESFTDTDLLLALSQMPSCSISFPRMFFDQNIDIYKRNIENIFAVLQSCLLSQSGLSERSTNIQDDPSAKSAIPLDFNDIKGYDTLCACMRVRACVCMCMCT